VCSLPRPMQDDLSTAMSQNFRIVMAAAQVASSFYHDIMTISKVVAHEPTSSSSELQVPPAAMHTPCFSLRVQRCSRRSVTEANIGTDIVLHVGPRIAHDVSGIIRVHAQSLESGSVQIAAYAITPGPWSSSAIVLHPRISLHLDLPTQWQARQNASSRRG